MTDLTHFNNQGRARMVDVSDKQATLRTAVAVGTVYMNQRTFELLQLGRHKKGDVLAVAQVAGIMGAKRCSDLIPMCHPVNLTGVDIRFELDPATPKVLIEATARCHGETGVEMEALTAVTAAALTIYDMCKAAQKDMVIGDVSLIAKSGGRSGDYRKLGEEK